MARVPVFYSFHFKNDVMRVQQVRQMKLLDGNPPASANDWERLKRTGKTAVERWIDQNMKYKRCVIVLIGSETSTRPWVRYEIEKAWKDGRALMGIHIHNLRCPNTGTDRKGQNPFKLFTFNDGRALSDFVPVYNPSPGNAYSEISRNLQGWINHAINYKKN